jgi:serine/threonine protein kinase/DNA polymerase III delta prime subunit
MTDHVGQRFGNYQVLRKLGEGGFAQVYLAEHQYLEIPAAIKVLHVRMRPETHERFRREARTIAHLQHPHIVRVLEFGIQEQTPYLVMEYAPGGTLRTRHPRGTRLPLEQIVTYVKQLAPALDYAHEQRVIHRDIKPENILLSAQQEVVLSDFGIAVVQPTTESLSTQDPAGTPLYMAPEQIRGKPCAASDQYALAVVVYEWLCGEPPFRGSRFQVYSQHLDHPPPGLGRRLPHLPSLVEDAVLGALAKDPQERFTSVQDFATVLEAACDATQPLVSQTPEGQVPPNGVPMLLVAPGPREADRSAESTPLQPMAWQRTADEQEPGQLVTPLPVIVTPTVSKPAGPPVAQRNRERLLRKVRSFWIAGVLEHSLHGAALIALGLQERPDAVATPWQLLLQPLAGGSHPLPAGTSIKEVYDAADGELLILGAPGSGKTTLLLELTRELLSRAEQDGQHPLPVVFPLSSWTSKQPPLADWLVEELHRSYQVPRELGQTLVNTDQILPLLDGLDEVATEMRTACIESINTYHQEHAFLPLVVSSRSADYLAQTARVKLTSAVTIQPLTQQQVEEYLAQAGEPLWALRVALHKDAALRELAETPLMLSILTLTYQDIPVEELLRGGIAPTRQQVFERYVERMLSRRGTTPSYSPRQTKGWLAWLAAQMKRQGQTIFYLERLQPDWLPSTRLLQAYHWGAIRLPGVLIGVLVSLAITPWFLSQGLGNVMVNTLLGGLLGGLLSGGGAAQPPAMNGRKMRQRSWQPFLQRLVIGSLIGLAIGLNYGLLGYGLGIGLIYGLSFGLSGILLQVLLVKRHSVQSPSQTSPPTGRMKWHRLISSTALRIALLTGLLVGPFYGLSAGLQALLSSGMEGALLNGPSSLQALLSFGMEGALLNGPSSGLHNGLGFGLIGGLLSILLIGRSMTVHLTEKVIWSWKSLGRSLWSSQNRKASLQIAALVGLIVGLSNWLVGFLADPGQAGLSIGMSVGLSVGLSSGLTTAALPHHSY